VRSHRGPQTLLSAVGATGAGTAISMGGMAMCALQTVITSTATVTWQGTIDGSNWIAVALADLNSTSRARATTTSTNGLYLFEPAAGITSLRPNVTSWTSGTVTVKAIASS